MLRCQLWSSSLACGQFSQEYFHTRSDILPHTLIEASGLYIKSVTGKKNIVFYWTVLLFRCFIENFSVQTTLTAEELHLWNRREITLSKFLNWEWRWFPTRHPSIQQWCLKQTVSRSEHYPPTTNLLQNDRYQIILHCFLHYSLYEVLWQNEIREQFILMCLWAKSSGLYRYIFQHKVGLWQNWTKAEA